MRKEASGDETEWKGNGEIVDNKMQLKGENKNPKMKIVA